MWWAGQGRNKCTDEFVGKCPENKSLGRPINTWKNNTETDPRESACKDVHLTKLAWPRRPMAGSGVTKLLFP
jgi:hypothetical protein